MNARRVDAAAGVIHAAQKTRSTAVGIAAALEAACLLQSPETVATSPWERAVAGLNALVDAGVAFHVEPDGHISAPFSDEHIEWDLKARRWVLTHDEDDEDVPHPSPCRVPASPDCTCPVTPEQARRIERDRPETDTAHDCNIPLSRRLDCGHCPHTCRCATEDPHNGPRSHRYELGRDLPEVTR